MEGEGERQRRTLIKSDTNRARYSPRDIIAKEECKPRCLLIALTQKLLKNIRNSLRTKHLTRYYKKEENKIL